MSETSPFVPLPSAGRRFTASRRVRWGDVDRHRRLRLDAVARYLQDVANDDTRDLGQDPMAPWIVRRTTIAIDEPPALGEVLHLTTFGGGVGSRWAERRTSVVGKRGARVEAASLWISIDAATGRPARLTDQFLASYGEVAAGRQVSARLRHERPDAGAARRAWSLRSTDHDPLGRVNNAATWEPVEDELARREVVPRWAEIEYGDAIEPADDVTLVSQADPAGTVQVWLTVDGAVRASVVVRPADDTGRARRP
ncbi:MAG: acyl-ACP thioesterase domain-containing protein [Iamia sp.]